ncbi:Snf7 [Carpediemonas membranifera]|uniref:Snf7 n=1 Tax=Carpediemonas membranifera TaxID=201153 RepID=A0A8J6ASN6_9EUKA|nr:Snf7 [Carpediemonas membranifera]QNO39402.1 vacuolar protein sorting 20-like A [Carpediemonas membranifera]|eukprot:KAG9390495.1 Snf7 [Carpediemonas membranifera]
MPLVGKGSKKNAIPNAEALTGSLKGMSTSNMMWEKRIEAEKARARELIRKDDRANAQLALRRARQFEHMVNRTTAMMGNLETIQMGIQSAQQSAIFVDTLTVAKKELDTAAKTIDTDKVQDMMDDMADKMDEINATTELLSEDMGMGMDLDVGDELAALEAELATESMAEFSAVSANAPPMQIPGAGVTAPPAATRPSEVDSLEDMFT